MTCLLQVVCSVLVTHLYVTYKAVRNAQTALAWLSIADVLLMYCWCIADVLLMYCWSPPPRHGPAIYMKNVWKLMEINIQYLKITINSHEFDINIS